MAVMKIDGNRQIKDETIQDGNIKAIGGGYLGLDINTKIADGTKIMLDDAPVLQADLDANNNAISNLSDGTTDDQAVNYGQLMQVATQSRNWKEALLHSEMLVDGTSGGVTAAQVIRLNAQLQAGDSITVHDGTNTFTMIADTDFSIGASINDTLDNLNTAIIADVSGTAVSTVTSLLGSLEPTNNVMIIRGDVVGETPRMWGNAGGATRIEMSDPTLRNLYVADAGDMVTIPAADPTTTNFGFTRVFADLTANETHVTRENDTTYTWNSDDSAWMMSGAASIPYSSKTVYGKVKIGDGMSVASGLIAVQAETSEGITVSSSGVAVDYDSSTLGIKGTYLSVLDTGITETQLNTSVAGSGLTGGAGQPLATNPGDGLEHSGDQIVVKASDLVGDGLSSTTNNLYIVNDGVKDYMIDWGLAASQVSTSDMPEGSNLYYTDERVDDRVSGLFVEGEGVDFVYDDGGNTFTVSGEDASDTNKGIATFNAADFDNAAGDITLEDTVVKTVTTDTGALTPVGHSYSVLGGEGMDVTHSGTVITVAGEDADVAGNKGIATFDAADFDATAGTITLEDTVLKTLSSETGAMTPSGHSLTIIGGEGMDVTHAGTTMTVAGEDASDTNKGIATFNAGDFQNATGDITLVDTVVKTVSTESGALTPSAHGFTITGGEGMDVTHVGQTITVAGEDADVAGNKGIATFDSGDFDSTTGTITLEDTVLKTITTDSGALTPTGHSLSVLGGEGMDVTHSGTTVTVAGEDATTSNKGISSFDSNNFSVTTGAVSLVADGVDDTHIDWGTGAGQVSAVDMPVADATGYWSATTVEGVLDEIGLLNTDFVYMGVGNKMVERRMVQNELVNETPNSVITDFTVDYTPMAGKEQVFLNGILQQEGASNDYTLATKTFTFATAPLAGDVILVTYIGSD